VAVRADEVVDDKLSALAESAYSVEYEPSTIALELEKLEALDFDRAYELAKTHLEKHVQFWDWDEDVDLIGLAKLVVLPERIT
jgi:hypothetical protein